MLFAEDPDIPETGRVLASIKANLSAPVPALKYHIIEAANGAAAVEWLGTSAHTATALLAVSTVQNIEKSDALADAKNVIRDLLEDGPVEATEADEQRKALGITEATWRRT